MADELTRLEQALVEHIKSTKLATKLRDVQALPDTDDKTLVQRFAADAPGIYVAMGGFPVADSMAVLNAGLCCVARNARGAVAAKQGDAKVIGLYEIIWSLSALMENACIGDACWKVTGVDMINSDLLYANGIYAAVVKVETTGAVLLDPAIVEDDLNDFATFHADLDVAARGGTEHAKWLSEPPDLSTSRPSAAINLNLPEETP